MVQVVSIWCGMHRFAFFDMYPTDYFGLTLNDLHSLIGEMANGEGWQQTSKRLALVNTSSRPDARRHKEVAYLVLPYTHHPLLPFPQGEKTLFPLSLSGLDTLSR